MLFHVQMTVRLPHEMPAAEADELKAREKAIAQQLQREGTWRHLWRIAGRYANVSVFDVPDNAALHDTLMTLPLFPYMDIEVQPITLEKAADGPPMLLDGRADALWGAGVGWPAFSALAKTGGRFLAPNEQEIATILRKNPALQTVTLPAKSYPGQDAALRSVGSWSYVLAKPALPEAAAYLLARAIHRAEAPLAARLEQARETTMVNTIAAAPRPELLHPGVRRYLAEAGLR